MAEEPISQISFSGSRVAQARTVAAPFATSFEGLSLSLNGQVELLRHVLHRDPELQQSVGLKACAALDQVAVDLNLAAREFKAAAHIVAIGGFQKPSQWLSGQGTNHRPECGENDQGRSDRLGTTNCSELGDTAQGQEPRRNAGLGKDTGSSVRGETLRSIAPEACEQQPAEQTLSMEAVQGSRRNIAFGSSSATASRRTEANRSGLIDKIRNGGNPRLQDPRISDGLKDLRTARFSLAAFLDFCTVLVGNAQFEIFFATVIVTNAAVMALEAQYRGSVLSIAGASHYVDDRAREWGMEYSEMIRMFDAFEIIFGIAFTVEVLLKLLGLRSQWPWDIGNWFDAAIVVSWCITMEMEATTVNTQLGRMLRLVKLFRLVKLVRQLKSMDALFLMATALEGSFRVLGWAVVLLLVMQILCALLVNQVLQEYFTDANYPESERQEIWLYFGTFTRSMLSMFELTLANWPPITRYLQEYHSEVWALICVCHKLTLGFAVVGVINGVFMQETFKVAAADDRIMVRQKEAAIRIHERKMGMFFNDADKSGDGYISVDEFREMAELKEVRTWLAAMDLDVKDADALFSLIDDGDGQVTVSELIRSVSMLKGAARSLDMNTVQLQMCRLEEKLDEALGKTTDKRAITIQPSLMRKSGKDHTTAGASPHWSPQAAVLPDIDDFSSKGPGTSGEFTL